jgi:hypothetical protein
VISFNVKIVSELFGVDLSKLIRIKQILKFSSTLF